MKLNKVAVIANFPYQVPDAGDSTGAKPIYHLFIESVIDNIKPDHFVSINPSKWMCGGKGLDSHRERMMNDTHMKEIHHFAGDKEVFSTVSIKGGVNFFLWSKEHNGECEFHHDNTTSKRFLNTHDIILQDNNAFGILDKVMNNTSNWISEKCLSSNPFGLRTNFSDFSDSGIKCIIIRQEEKFVNPNVVNDKNGILNKWKVCTSNGGNVTENKLGQKNILGSYFIMEPNVVCTETYIVVNVFDTKREADNFMEYMKTKFFRFMLGLRALTQHITKDKFSWVPDLKDYSTVWTDKELYKEFGLGTQEIKYIERKIKAI